MLRVRLVLLALLIAALAPVATAHATDINVTTIDDVVAGDGACSLREAVIAARSNLASADCPAGELNAQDHISIPAAGAPYTLTIDGAGEDQGATGDLDLGGGDLLITGAGQGQTMIDANGIDRVFDVLGAAVELRDLEITQRTLSRRSEPAGRRGRRRGRGQRG